MAYLRLTCPKRHEFELRSFEFPEGAPITFLEELATECPVCDTPTTAAAGVYVAIGDEVVYTPGP